MPKSCLCLGGVARLMKILIVYSYRTHVLPSKPITVGPHTMLNKRIVLEPQAGLFCMLIARLG